MFEQAFLWSMRHGSRLLFAAACFMLLIGLFSFGWSIVEFHGGPSDWPLLSLALGTLYPQIAPAGYLFIGALLVDRLSRESQNST